MTTQSPSQTEVLSYFFERPTEPIFKNKGRDGSVQLVVPERFYTDRYRPLYSILSTRGPGVSTQVQVRDLTTLPDLTIPSLLGRDENLSLFNEFHRDCADKLIEIFMAPTSFDNLISTAAYAHDRVNPYLFIYALSVAALHRPDTRNLSLRNHLHIFPQLYLDRRAFSTAREEQNYVPAQDRRTIDIPRDYTATDLDPEHRVAYFREDVGANLHHWHWHLVYPHSGPMKTVNKNRRGELFYYMHQQLVARYDMERLCNQLPRVKKFNDFRQPIEEGYYPKLDNLVAGRLWPARHPNTFLSDLRREKDQVYIDIQDLERWRDRIFEAIHTGRYLEIGNSDPVPFTEATGIDILGNLVEASVLSVNPNEYGNLHNQGHNVTSYIHDPDNRYLEKNAVMGDPSTAMRDPLFFRWHSFINHIFVEYKKTLPPYTATQLGFENVQITSVHVQTTGASVRNQLFTFWQYSDIDLTHGLDFADTTGSIYARVTHLQHAPFTYTIQVQNSGNARMGTVRIFYAPKYIEQGTAIYLRDQKNMFVELDRFTYNLQSGANTITRNSESSSVTIPYEQTFHDQSSRTGAQNFCGCGWPDHMLVCKGTFSGYVCELFVMISDYSNDSVEGSTAARVCDDASSYCGVKDSLYPDRRAMGFPFDRFPPKSVKRLSDFLTSNMAAQDITVQFTARIVA